MALNDRIRRLRIEKGLTQIEFGQLFCVTGATVSMWENNKSVPSASNLQKISQDLNVSFRWLTEGAGLPSRDGLIVVGKAEAGLWRENEPSAFGAIPVFPDPRYPPDAQHAFEMIGNSANKVLSNGDFAHAIDIEKANLSARHGDLILVVRHRHGLSEYTIKRLHISGDVWKLNPESVEPEFQVPIVIDADTTEVELRAIIVGRWSPIERGPG